MKKVILILTVVALAATSAIAFSSCKKAKDESCTCTERHTGFSETITDNELEGMSCKEFEDLLNLLADEEEGINQDWSCR